MTMANTKVFLPPSRLLLGPVPSGLTPENLAMFFLANACGHHTGELAHDHRKQEGLLTAAQVAAGDGPLRAHAQKSGHVSLGSCLQQPFSRSLLDDETGQK